jgi:hypothetical protein
LPALRADITTPRILATVAVAAACLSLGTAKTSAAAQQPNFSSGGAGIVQQPLTARGGVFVGISANLSGHIDGYSGAVALTARRGNRGDFLPIGNAHADRSGDFTFRWKPPASGLYRVQIVPLGTAAAATEPARGSLSVYRRQKATWYGPESYGSRTACGIKLTRRTLGVAHKTLPCGTRVEFFLRGRRITVPVIDRGPYANGAVWDLTLTAMRRLGSSSTEFLGALPLG